MRKDITNKTFGKLTALRFSKFEKRKTYWLFECTCGTIVEKRIDGLSDKIISSCGCFNKTEESYKFRSSYNGRKKPNGDASFLNLYTKYKASAKRRNKIFDLSLENFKNLTSSTCHYCGSEPKQVCGRDWLNGKYLYNGVDRVDNNIGYVEGNVVTCCKICNQAKHILSLEDFKEWIDRLIKHNTKC